MDPPLSRSFWVTDLLVIPFLPLVIPAAPPNLIFNSVSHIPASYPRITDLHFAIVYAQSTSPLAPTDLNPQPLQRGGGIEYLAESSKSRRSKAMGVVNKIGRALSITKSKDRRSSINEVRPLINPSYQGHPATSGVMYTPKALRPHFTGPLMMPLRDDECIITDRRRRARPPIPLRSHQLSHPQPSTQSGANTLYDSRWNQSRHALSVFEMSSSPTSDSNRVHVHPNGERDVFQQPSRPGLSMPTTPKPIRNDQFHPRENVSATEVVTSNRPLPVIPKDTVTPQRRSKRKPVPVTSSFFNESFESLIEKTTPSSVEESWKPLKIVRRPSSIMLEARIKEIQAKDTIHTPPTPKFGQSLPCPSPTPSSESSTVDLQTFGDPLIDVLPETSFEIGQDNLFDEVLTSWNLPPLSRSNSLVLDKIHPSTKPDRKKEEDRLSRSTGKLNLVSRGYRERDAEIRPVPTFYPSGRSFEPIRATKSSDMLRTIQYSNAADSREESKDQREVGGRVKKAVEVLEGRRDPSESPPTPWKEMAKLLRPKKSDSSIGLQEETRQMMSEARERMSKPKTKSRFMTR
ncbi:hypothetical protein I204_02536 [Kwoniella mangroviensis CBS 8886]|nr:hypothetical protein I204_02536 [Kwoniella mangroviensis CBS 8886]